ncbi:Lrp/AsnC family transcriptional regulator [Streptacidiphilus carbonis]|uniref:Lrp/AsnC family transcriptional regulator n=1 Tax=Streptacidiphilus carbonis TaxID=105422 RepID=UPI0005AB8995|nr:AsnC family transcriptional regulator [Streptacidiphilus carbonis]
MKSHEYDRLDRQLVRALELDGRAPFSRIAQALGVSDQTVARRYARLRGRGALQIMGLTSPAVLGEVQWIIRVQCTPDGAAPVAEALARRDDTAWISLISGGTEITCVSRSGNDRGDSLLLQRLPKTRSVVGVTAYCVLHTYFGESLSLVSKLDTLTAEQVRQLAPEPSTAAPRPAEAVDEADDRMLALLQQDGRAGLAGLASASGLSQTSVRRRMAELTASGVLYLDVDFDRRIFGLNTVAMLWLSVSPSELARTGRDLAAHPEVAFCCATTGPTNLHAVVVCKDIPAFYTYLTTSISALDAVQHVETGPVLRRLKAAAPYPSAPGDVRYWSGRNT